ncbi:LOW QUALITY PROTEIN: aconitate hydratase [Geomicrobium sp. JCM 19037]|nr:LOW QUALITY PROTEIN: aconitate hydratase [Geomicrobium sp. JCM 19037]
MSETNDLYQAKKTFDVNGESYVYYDLQSLSNVADVTKLPYSIKVLLESLLRQQDGKVIKKEHVESLAKWGTKGGGTEDVPFKPSRVILQDFTGVPAVVDLASLRKAIADFGGDPSSIDPAIPADLVVDHSVQVDQFGTSDALMRNMNLEFERNEERYKLLSWATKAFENYSAVPPATGIVHQVNLEYLANVVHVGKNDEGEKIAFPDTLVGTDSHTTMINGIGVLGWGVGGIEAEAGMLQQPSYFPAPEVVGVRLEGKLPDGATATDLALKVTQLLRSKNVVGKFVEFFGPGLSGMSLADRATISNMAPEYGATCGFFPVDEEALNYMRLTGRSEEQIAIVKAYSEANGLYFTEDAPEPTYSEVVKLDMSNVDPALSGPKRPQDLIELDDMQKSFKKAVTAPAGNHGFGLEESELERSVDVEHPNGKTSKLDTGAVTIAAITSCTNTSNPSVMIGAGLVAKKAVEKGLDVPEYVKTSLAPGSKVVTRYLEDSLMPYLNKLGFNLVGYGCTTCIGNSGPLPDEIEKAIADNDMLVSSVLSGNRNFEGRIHPLVRANYLASPPLVVAYALAGNVNFDLRNDSFGKDANGTDVYFKDLWPSSAEIESFIRDNVSPQLFKDEYADVFDNNERWNALQSKDNAELYNWDEESTYIQNPPFFEDMSKDPKSITSLNSLRAIGKFGDSVTTDHISPAGSIAKNSPAGEYLMSKGLKPAQFNSYGSRRGNHEVMMRGTFANIRIKNQLAPGTEGGFTTYWPTDEVMPIYDAAMKYKEEDTGLVVMAGEDYGMGSSRDWAAKGTNLLGIKMVIAQSFERIHRSNLALMGVLPLQFKKGEGADSLGLTGKETFDINITDAVTPRDTIQVTATDENGKKTSFDATVRFDSEVEIDYYRHGGILPMVLRNKLKEAANK